MKTNISRLQAIFRMALGSLMFFFFIIGGPIWNILGLYLMISGAFRFCPIYYYLGYRNL